MKVMVACRSSFLLPSDQHGLNGELLIFDRSYTTTLGKMRRCLFRGQFGNGAACRRCRRHSRTARVCQSFDAPPFCSAVCTARACRRFMLMCFLCLCRCHSPTQHYRQKYKQYREPVIHTAPFPASLFDAPIRRLGMYDNRGSSQIAHDSTHFGTHGRRI